MLDIGGTPPRRPPRVLVGRQSELAWCVDAFARRRVLAIYGLAGIGKTSLLLAGAHEHMQRVEAMIAYHACAEGERIGDVLGALLSGGRPATNRGASLRAALDSVVAWATRTPLVLCIDDAHRLDDPLLIDVLAHLGAASAPLWIALASRRQLPLPEADIDGAVLRLGPLSLDGARALWRDLEERFGPSIARFDALDGALRGIPFALRRAFATGQGDASGVDLSGLGPDQAALLAQLCAFRGPVDVGRLRPLIPECMAALPALLQALLVEVTDTGSVAVHDLVRASVTRSARPPTAAEHRVCLAFHDGDGDALARLHHTVAAEQWAAAVVQIDDLVKPQYGLFPLGGTVESQVRAAFAALERAGVDLPLSLRLARLQLSARHGEGRTALDALHSEAAREPAAWVHLATVELVLGDSIAAEAHIRQALADPSISSGPIARAFLLATLVEALRRQGQVEQLGEVAAEFTAAAAQLGPIGAGVAQVGLAAIAYDQEDFERAAEHLSSARPAIALLGFVPAFQATHALLERACSAALSRLLHDEPRPATVARALFEDVDFLRAMLLLFVADADMFDGNVADAEARADDAEAIAVRGGYRGLQQWALSTRGDCLRMRGRAAEAVALAERALADPLTAVHRRQRVMFLTISALGLAQLGRLEEAQQRVGSLDEHTHAPVRAARLSVLPWITPAPATSELARAELALGQLERALSRGQLEDARRFCEAAAPVRASRWQYLRARLGVLDAELAVRTGDAARAESALREAEALGADRGYLREHATAALLSIAVAQLAGDRERALEGARAAVERAAGRFPEIEAAAARLLSDDRAVAGRSWSERLELTEPRSFRLRTAGATHDLTRRQADALRFTEGTLVIDARRRTVRVGGVEHSLAKRPVLWSVLSLLAMEPGRSYSPEEIVGQAWDEPFHLIRHRGRVVVTISRLRDMLGDDAIVAESGSFPQSVAVSYRLSVAAWAVLEPVPDAG